MPRVRVGIVGAGNVGASLAQVLVQKNLCDVVISDIVEGLPQGKALDMSQSRSPGWYDASVVGTNNVAEMNGCRIVVVTAGVPRKPGMTREQLLEINSNIIRDVCSKVKTFNPRPILIVVTNPLDVMTYLALKLTGFDRKQVFGMAGVLDSARFVHFISTKLQVSVKDIQTMIIGSHGDTMVALPRYTTVSGIPLTQLLSQGEIDDLVKRARDGGIEIVNLLKTGSAYYAPASSIAVMVEAILKNENRVLPCAVYLNGEYSLNDVVIGVPVKVGEGGVVDIIKLSLEPNELRELHRSASVVKENINLLKL